MFDSSIVAVTSAALFLMVYEEALHFIGKAVELQLHITHDPTIGTGLHVHLLLDFSGSNSIFHSQVHLPKYDLFVFVLITLFIFFE